MCFKAEIHHQLEQREAEIKWLRKLIHHCLSNCGKVHFQLHYGLSALFLGPKQNIFNCFMTEANTKSNINTLKSFYVKELAKIKASKNGLGTDDLYNSKWAF